MQELLQNFTENKDTHHNDYTFSLNKWKSVLNLKAELTCCISDLLCFLSRLDTGVFEMINKWQLSQVSS